MDLVVRQEAGSGRTGWSGKLNERSSLWMLKPKCNTDFNVASITTQWRNVNRSAGTPGVGKGGQGEGRKLTSCSGV